MKYVWSAWPSLHRKISAEIHKLLILDFDGTLTKITRIPQDVVLERKTIDVLTALSRSPFYKIAIISGRSLENLTAYFDIKNAVYAGNHGLELKGGKLRLPRQAKKAKKLEALVWLLGEKLREDLSGVPGVIIEDKNFTLSLHYRNISREHLPFFNQEVSRFRKQYAHWPLVWRRGKKVWEVRPGVKWDKGDAALFIAGKFPAAFPIVIGDDLTDEDMFKALKHRGLTIRVGRSTQSRASYYLKSTHDVGRLLEELCRS